MRRINQHGIRLLEYWEKADPRKTRCTPAGAALETYICPGGKVTIWFGCTTWFDGGPVRSGYTLDPARGPELMAINLEPFERIVDELLPRSATDNQFSSHVALAFNIGVGAWRECTALERAKQGNWEDADDAMTWFTGATTYSPTGSQRADPEYAGVWESYTSGRGEIAYRWINADGEPCGYMTRLSGLLARHSSGACLANGYDWAQACAYGKVQIKLRPPSHRYFDSRRNRWVDRVASQTPLDDVLDEARRYPLPDLDLFEAPAAETRGEVEEVVHAPSSAPPPLRSSSAEDDLTIPRFGQSAPEAAPVASAGLPEAVTHPLVPVGTKAPSVYSKKPEELGLDPSLGLKPLEQSDRAKGYLWQQVGRFFLRAGAAGAFGTGSAGVFGAVENDLALQAIILSLFVPFAISVSAVVIGYVSDVYGRWKQQRGLRDGSQGLY